MIKHKVVDNFIEDKDFFIVLTNELLYNTGHFFRETSNFDYKKGTDSPGEKRFYSADLDYKQIAHRFLVHKVCLRLNKLRGSPWMLTRMYINVQHTGMEGYWHTDSDADVTAILMLTGSGSFSFPKKKIKFVPNRLIMFDSKMTHRGNKPDGDSPRVTLAMKLKKQ